MIKRIIASLAMVALTGALTIGAARAYFTDQETVSFAMDAAKVNIKINGVASVPITLGNLQPGIWSPQQKLEVYNQNTPLSTVSVKYRFQDLFGSQSVAGLYDKLNVRVRHTFAGTPNPGSWPVVYNGPLKDLLVDSTVTPGMVAASLGVNITHVFYFDFELDTTAGNTFQGSNATFSLVFDATQTNNPGWTE